MFVLSALGVIWAARSNVAARKLTTIVFAHQYDSSGVLGLRRWSAKRLTKRSGYGVVWPAAGTLSAARYAINWRPFGKADRTECQWIIRPTPTARFCDAEIGGRQRNFAPIFRPFRLFPPLDENGDRPIIFDWVRFFVDPSLPGILACLRAFDPSNTVTVGTVGRFPISLPTQ